MLFKRVSNRKTIPELTEDEKQQLTSISIRARDILKTFAMEDHNEKTAWGNEFLYNCGGHEGCCVLLAAAHFDMEDTLFGEAPAEKGGNDDQLLKKDANYSHATLEAYRLIDNMMAFVSTALVVMSLVITIAATLMATALSPFSEHDSSLGGDVSLFRQWANNTELMFAAHCLETIFLSLSALSSAVGMYMGFLLYGAIGIYMITLEQKLGMLIEYRMLVGMIWACTATSLLFLVLTFPFITARISPVLCLSSVVVPVGLIVVFYATMPIVTYIGMEQHKAARAVFGIPLERKLEG